MSTYGLGVSDCRQRIAQVNAKLCEETAVLYDERSRDVPDTDIEIYTAIL